MLETTTKKQIENLTMQLSASDAKVVQLTEFVKQMQSQIDALSEAVQPVKFSFSSFVNRLNTKLFLF